MKIIDVHSHWGTKRGYTLRTEEELAQQKKTWNSEPTYHTEDEMADILPCQQRAGDPRFRLHEIHAARRSHSDPRLRLRDTTSAPEQILGHWIHIEPATGDAGVRELQTMHRQTRRLIGFAVSGSGSGPPSDPKWFPFYELCIEARCRH